MFFLTETPTHHSWRYFLNPLTRDIFYEKTLSSYYSLSDRSRVFFLFNLCCLLFVSVLFQSWNEELDAGFRAANRFFFLYYFQSAFVVVILLCFVDHKCKHHTSFEVYEDEKLFIMRRKKLSTEWSGEKEQKVSEKIFNYSSGRSKSCEKCRWCRVIQSLNASRD